jgi:hypothetical protein
MNPVGKFAFLGEVLRIDTDFTASTGIDSYNESPRDAPFLKFI